MAHRIREAMRDGGLAPLGGDGKIVEADETYFGKIEAPRVASKQRKGRPYTKGGTGWPVQQARHRRACRARRSCPHVPCRGCRQGDVDKIVSENIARETRLHTDESSLYSGAEAHFAAHETVKHSRREYVVRGDVHTNSAEGYFSIFKRGMRGIYQHCDEKHLHRYLAEYDFRYNHRAALGYNDIDRTSGDQGVAGKRLTYRQPH